MKQMIYLSSMFKASQEYSEILSEVKELDILFKEADFKCYSDSIFTFEIIHNEFISEFNVIAESETFLEKMFISDLLDLKRVYFFQHSIYDRDSDEKLGSIQFVRDINPN